MNVVFPDLDFVETIMPAESAIDGSVLAIELEDGRIVAVGRTAIALYPDREQLESCDDEDEVPRIEL